MRALTLRQPWAWLVVHGGKDIENRIWATRFRGWFLIHASREMSASDYLDAARFCAELDLDLPALPPATDFRLGVNLGGIVGLAQLVGVLPPIPFGMGALPRWRMAGQYGFQLEGVHPLPFVGCPGALQFWRLKPAERERIPPGLWPQLEAADAAFGGNQGFPPPESFR